MGLVSLLRFVICWLGLLCVCSLMFVLIELDLMLCVLLMLDCSGLFCV